MTPPKNSWFAGYNQTPGAALDVRRQQGRICLFTRYAAGALALFCVATALIAHFDFADQNQMNAFLKNLAVAGGFLVLAVTGAGAISIDARRG